MEYYHPEFLKHVGDVAMVFVQLHDLIIHIGQASKGSARTAGFHCGDVAMHGENSKLLLPREPKSVCMPAAHANPCPPIASVNNITQGSLNEANTRVPPPQPNPYQMPRKHTRVPLSVLPYQAPAGHPRAQLVRQRNTQASSFSVGSPEQLPEAIFRFLDLSEINIALREEEPKLYIIMFSNLNYLLSCPSRTGTGSVKSI